MNVRHSIYDVIISNFVERTVFCNTRKNTMDILIAVIKIAVYDKLYRFVSTFKINREIEDYLR